jgi:hypothetical protein
MPEDHYLTRSTTSQRCKLMLRLRCTRQILDRSDELRRAGVTSIQDAGSYAQHLAPSPCEPLHVYLLHHSERRFICSQKRKLARSIFEIYHLIVRLIGAHGVLSLSSGSHDQPVQLHYIPQDCSWINTFSHAKSCS